VLSGLIKHYCLFFALILVPTVDAAASKIFPPDLLPMVKEKVGDNIVPLSSSKKKMAMWHILDRVSPRTDAIYVYLPAKVSLRVAYPVEEVVFFWGIKADSSVQYRIIRKPGLTSSPRTQVINFNGGPLSECKSPWPLVMLLRVGNLWYYDAKKVGFLLADCGSN